MQVVLENEALKVTINSFGAELASIRGKETDTEYLWNADAKFWKRSAPVLFPFVGSLKNKEYHYEGKAYPMGAAWFCQRYGVCRGCTDGDGSMVFPEI